jgi:hypothetical protein
MIMSFSKFRIPFFLSFLQGFSIITLCLLPSSSIPELNVLKFEYSDILVHFSIFTLFSLGFHFELQKYFRQKARSLPPWWLSTMAGLLLGFTTEMLQLILEELNRTANIYDFLFDLGGNFCGFLIWKFIVQKCDSAV